MANEGGSILPVNKPKGVTSFEVVRAVRHALRLKKVGHAGTLDPLAEGLLIILTGNKTKLMSDFLKLDKEYLATLRLGVTSKSHDLETELVTRDSDVDLPIERINEVLVKFTGTIEQVPPEFSAAWVGGKRAYSLARRGVEFELKPKKVTITELVCESLEAERLKLRVVCTSGTYIRSLARDIGEELGCGAVLEDLVRTRIGSYSVEEAAKLNDFTVRDAA